MSQRGRDCGETKMLINGKELVVSYIKVVCPTCGEQWGIRLPREDDFKSILPRQVTCRVCNHNKAVKLGELNNEIHKDIPSR